MPNLKFSHKWDKLFISNQTGDEPVRVTTRALLVNMVDTDYSKLSEELKKEDTKHRHNIEWHFPKKGRCLILCFKREEDGGKFTTIRSAYPVTKILYYKRQVGKLFDVLYVPLKRK